MGMGSYNYEALHKSAPIIKRGWIPDPLTANRGYINGNVRAVDPYLNGYGNNALQDRLAMAQAQAQVQMLGGINGVGHYGLPNEPLPVGLIPPDHLVEVAERDRYANVYPNGLPVRRSIFQPRVRKPRRERKKRKGREPEAREPEVREPVRAMSTSQSPAQSPAPIPDVTEEPPLAGMIFGCTSDTYMECMQWKLFALPAANKSEVMRVAPGTKLFLYNYQARELSGIFEATSQGDMDLEPDAFQGLFPAQVRMRCIQQCPNLPLKAFKEAMSENFEKNKNKFKYSLNDVQVRKLMTLFRQELKYWKKQRVQQERKIRASGLQPGLRPGYPSRNEITQLAFFQPTKRIRMF
ncbi:hypothetical protein M758_1G082300 [Ceratodon purpureus]|nr:hypothetical protein M758_1G082300 [Ceratodon purpureus]